MVAEKTLELNLTAELLDYYRRTINPACFFKGLTLREEGIWGYDTSLVRGGTVSEILFFQYKAFRKNKQHFFINNNRNKDQHQLLLNIALTPRSVFYIFPLFNTDLDVSKASPNLLQKTYFVDVSEIGPLTPKWHKVVINPARLEATIYSERKTVKLIPGSIMVSIIKEKEHHRFEDSNVEDPVLKSRPLSIEKVNLALEKCFADRNFRKKNKIRSKQIASWGLLK